MISIKNLIFLIFKLIFLFLYLICIIFLFVTIFIIPKTNNALLTFDEITSIGFNTGIYKINSIIPSSYNIAIKPNYENYYKIDYPHYYINCIYTNLGGAIKNNIIEIVSQIQSKNFGDIILNRYKNLYFARYFSNVFNYTLDYNITANGQSTVTEIEMSCSYILKLSTSDLQIYYFLIDHLLIFISYIFIFIFYKKYVLTYREKILFLLSCIFVLFRIIYIDIIKILSLRNIIHESSAIQQVINFIVLFLVDIIIFIFQFNIYYRNINTVLPCEVRRDRRYVNIIILGVFVIVGILILIFCFLNFFGGILYENILSEFLAYIPESDIEYNTNNICNSKNEYSTCNLTYSILIKVLKYIPNTLPMFITFHFLFNVIYGNTKINQNEFQ